MRAQTNYFDTDSDPHQMKKMRFSKSRAPNANKSSLQNSDANEKLVVTKKANASLSELSDDVVTDLQELGNAALIEKYTQPSAKQCLCLVLCFIRQTIDGCS